MKKLFKNVNVAGLAVVLIAAGVITTQSAFKSEKLRTTTLYGKDSTLPLGWRNIGAVPEDATSPYGDNTYRCESNPTNICSGRFDDLTPPTGPASVPISGTTRTGNFIYTAP